MSATCENTNDNLLAVIQIFRHGQRSPLYIYPNDPYKDNWPYGLGQLTKEGERQLYDLGKDTRKRYQDFLPTEWSKEDFSCYTTNYKRTQVSAQAYVNGLYPLSDTSVWNVYQQSRSIPLIVAEKAILHSSAAHCPTYMNIWNNILKETFEKVKNNYGDIVQYISYYTGTTITDIVLLSYIHDTLFTENMLGYKLPTWSKSVYPKLLKRFGIMFLESMGATDQLRRLAAGPFLNEVVVHFDKILKDPSSCQKFVAYSGHDSNIHIILQTLGYPPHIPHYASTIYFELRKNKTGDAYVNIYYKNEELEPITVAGGDFNCTLSQFKYLLSAYLIDFDTFSEECTSVIVK